MMAKLIYAAISSLDGYMADADGNFDWSAPDGKVHKFINEGPRPSAQGHTRRHFWANRPSHEDLCG
jgi:hypothetical protein